MRAALGALFIICAMPAWAVQPDEILSDPAQEARAREISKELRCLVCRNESIDDSSAGLARDLRLLVRERIEAGDSNAEVKDYLVDRYGEFVLLKPRWSTQNMVLWLAGPVLFFGGAVAAVAYLRRSRSGVAADAALSPEEQAAVERILRDGE